MERRQKRASQLAANSLSEEDACWLALVLKREKVMVSLLVGFSHLDLVVVF